MSSDDDPVGVNNAAGSAWLWPYVPSPAVRSAVTRFSSRVALLTEGPRRWVPCAVVAGALPLCLAFVTRIPLAQGVSAVALGVLLLPAALSRNAVRGLATIATVFAVHSSLAIALSAWDPSGARAVLPGAGEYWSQAHRWIVTGVNPEYELAAWLPAHSGCWPRWRRRRTPRWG